MVSGSHGAARLGAWIEFDYRNTLEENRTDLIRGVGPESSSRSVNPRFFISAANAPTPAAPAYSFGGWFFVQNSDRKQCPRTTLQRRSDCRSSGLIDHPRGKTFQKILEAFHVLHRKSIFHIGAFEHAVETFEPNLARVRQTQREDVWPASVSGHIFGRREAGRPESLRKMRRTSLRLVPCRPALAVVTSCGSAMFLKPAKGRKWGLIRTSWLVDGLGTQPPAPRRRFSLRQK